MCGIVGFLGKAGGEGAPLLQTAAAMARRLAHRGPDDAGTWADAGRGIALGHRRLSVLDLSPAGHQPMPSGGGRWLIVYNGEIYNHLSLRKQLEAAGAAPGWRGFSDTETLLACVETWGVEETLKRCVGMFAIALWDREQDELWLARDRLGEKPLYYGWQAETFLFGSELKALRAHPSFNADVDRDALALLLRHNYVPEPYSIYRGIRKLPPGNLMRVRRGEYSAEPCVWWSLEEVAERGRAHPFQGSEADAVDALERVLGSAVKGQMLADVPLGALLSGGIDSTLVAALMQVGSGSRVRTFTIGFDEKQYDESHHARSIALHLGTDHTELQLSAQDALGLIPRLPEIYDEPFADCSQIPTHLVMKLARQHVTVALSGDAGDEFFAGYNRYRFLPKAWRSLGRLPGALRRPALELAGLAPDLLGKAFDAAQVADKLRKVRRLFDAQPRSVDDLYAATVTEWTNPADVVVRGAIPSNLLDARERWPDLADPVERMMALDALTYLPGDILAKVDRAAMAVSLETRAPFLDRDVVEFAWTLPVRMKLRDGKGKWLLRQLLDRYVPRGLFERPKQGFGIPIDEWLRGPLRDWADALLSDDRLRREGYFHAAPVRQAWLRHLRGEASCGYRLWSVLMFQAWLERQEV